MLVLQLGRRCNNACLLCSSKAERDAPEPSVDGLFKKLDGIMPGTEVVFVGGEPTIQEELPSLVAHAKRRSAGRILVKTNGRRLVYRAYAEALREVGVDGLEVSLFGSSPSMHDYHTGVDGSYLQTVRGMSQGLAVGMKVVVGCAVTRSNYRNLSEIVQVVGGGGIRTLRLHAPILSGPAVLLRDRILAHPELVLPYLRKAEEVAKHLDVHLLLGTRPHPDFAPLSDEFEASTSRAPIPKKAAETHRSKANPGREELRFKEARTGSDLRGILPALFESTEGDQ